jgi:hypothetical protein
MIAVQIIILMNVTCIRRFVPWLLLNAEKIQRLKIVRLVDMFRFRIQVTYLTTSAQKVPERPTDTLEMAKASIPRNSIGFLPMWSDMRLQNMTVARAAS